MNRLVLQHPALPEAAVTDVARMVGAGPDRRESSIACWNHVRMERTAALELAERHAVDLSLTPSHARLSDYRLIAFDMDSTLITIECIDEIADFAGRKAEVAAITEATMRGEIPNFNESLMRRVALLAGLPEQVLQEVFEARLQLSPGAQTLVDAARASGLKVLLVSGGFTFYTERLRERVALDFTRANELEIIDGRLTGRVLGEIVNADVKQRTVEETCVRLGCQPVQAIVVGDGANDLKMMGIAGMSVAYRAKPVVRAQTTHAINHCGLDAILNFFGNG